MLRDHPVSTPRYTTNLPKDAKLLAVYADFAHLAIEMIYESEAWTAVAEGEPTPDFYLQYTAYTDGA